MAERREAHIVRCAISIFAFRHIFGNFDLWFPYTMEEDRNRWQIPAGFTHAGSRSHHQNDEN